MEAVIEKISNEINATWIGVTYVLQIMGEYFYCGLCDSEIESDYLISHLKSNNHRLKYLNLHFPSVFKALQSSFKFLNNVKFQEATVTNICGIIAAKTSFVAPQKFNSTQFKAKKVSIIDEVKKLHHYSEDDFTDGIEALLRVFNNHKNHDDSSPELKFSAFFKDYLIILKQINNKYIHYQEKPMSHPFYQSEWDLYWMENTYDRGDITVKSLTPLWKLFWADHMKQLRHEEINEKKKEIERKMNLNVEEVRIFNEKLLKRIEKFSDLPESDDDENVKRNDVLEMPSTSSNDSPQPSTTNLFTILRTLLTLTTEVGFLMSRITNLFERAEALECKEENSSNNLLNEFKTFNFVETLNEKFKAAIGAKLVEEENVETLLKVIEKLDELLTKAKPNQKLEAAKYEIAQQLAKVLFEKGVRDLSEVDIEEILEQLTVA